MTARADIADRDVRAAFEAFPDAFHQPLRDLRQLILETAESDPRVGALQETLKWGQPSWLPVRPRVGTTIRLGTDRSGAHLALFFHCQTSVIRNFRSGPAKLAQGPPPRGQLPLDHLHHPHARYPSHMRHGQRHCRLGHARRRQIAW